MVQEGNEVGLLPANFLFTLGHSFSPLDTSGLMVLIHESFGYYACRFAKLKENLGIGQWDKLGSIFRFGDRWSSLGDSSFIFVEVKPQGLVFGLCSQDLH